MPSCQAKQLNDVQASTKPAQLVANLARQYGYKTSYNTAYRVRRTIQQGDIASHNDAFRQLPSYLDRLADGDPNGSYDLRISGNRVSQVFIAPFCSKTAFQHLPPLFSVDGCHSRAVNDYTLLLATAHDANSHIIVLAWGHCESESIETWTWFFEHLLVAYPSLNRQDRTLISDRDKGIAYAADTILPLVHHAHCTQHMKENVKTRFGKEMSKMFPALVYASSKDKFNIQLQAIKEENEAAAAYIGAIPPERWARHAFKNARFGYTTSNVAEQTNAWLRPHRSQMITQLYDAIWNWQARQYQIRAFEGEQMVSQVVPKAKDWLEKEKQQSIRYLAIVTMENERVVRARVDPLDNLNPLDHQRAVCLFFDTNRASCTCIDATDYSLPCRHIQAVCSIVHQQPKCFIHPCHFTASYKVTYHTRFPIIFTDSLAIRDDLQPPVMRTGKGQTQRKRFEPGHRPSAASQIQREAGPSQALGTQGVLAGAARKLRRCGKCKKIVAHNARTCTEPMMFEDAENDLY